MTGFSEAGWHSRLAVLAAVVWMALPQPTAFSQAPVEPEGVLAIASKAPALMTIVGLHARTILAHVATGAGTEGIGISPDGNDIYTSSVHINEIVRIDTRTLQVVGRAVMHNCLGAVRVVPTPTAGRTLVVNCADNGRVLLVDADTLEIRHDIAVGTLPIGITVPNDRIAYVANMADDTISVIDIHRGAVARTIPAGDEPDGIMVVVD